MTAVVSDAAPKDPALGGGDRWMVVRLTGRDGSGHHADQGEQANHGVELVLTVLSRRKAFFYAAQDASIPGDIQRFRPPEQTGNPGQPVLPPSLAPPRAPGPRQAEMPVILAWI